MKKIIFCSFFIFFNFFFVKAQKSIVKLSLEQISSVNITTSSRGIPDFPEIDFSKFGPIEIKPLSRIKKKAGFNLHRSWLNLPIVTHHDEADITDLENFRKSLKEEALKSKLIGEKEYDKIVDPKKMLSPS